MPHEEGERSQEDISSAKTVLCPLVFPRKILAAQKQYYVPWFSPNVEV